MKSDLIAIVALVATAAIVAACIAIVLFIRWRRNRFQFSIRALLMSFVALACALFAYMHWIAPMVAHRWAIQNIYSSGGAVLFREDFQPGSANIYSDPSKANPWRGVSILHARSDAEAMIVSRELRHLPEADSLFLSSRVTDVGLAALCDNADQSSIDTVDLMGSPVTAVGLSHLANFKHLRLLFVNSCPIQDADLATLKSLPTLRDLTLIEEGKTGNPKRFTEAAFREVGQLKQLEKLWLANLEISDPVAEHLKNLTGLKKLQLSRCQISDDAIRGLRQALPQCEFDIYKTETPATKKK
jgi:hypothetical protein